jgi:hypothetical protein
VGSWVTIDDGSYLAVSRSGSAVGGPIAIAVGVGVLSGLFLGTWAAFVSKTHLFEELDRKLDARSGSVDAKQPFRSGRSEDQ